MNAIVLESGLEQTSKRTLGMIYRSMGPSVWIAMIRFFVAISSAQIIPSGSRLELTIRSESSGRRHAAGHGGVFHR